MKTPFVATILAINGTLSIAQAKPAGIFDTDRELRRGPRDCTSFLERYAERDTVAEDDFAAVITGLSNRGNVVAEKMLEKMQREAEKADCINNICTTEPDSFSPGICRPDDEDDGETRRALRRHGGGSRGGFGGGRRGGIEDLCDNLDDADEVIDELTEAFEEGDNKYARRAIMMLTMGTMMCDEF